MNPTNHEQGARPVREVSDAELDEAAARVRRHARRERLAMGLAILVGFGGVAAWFAVGTVLAFVGSLVVGSVLYSALRPKGDPLDESPALPPDPEVERLAADLRRGERRRLLGFVGSHLLIGLLTGVGAIVGLVVGALVAIKAAQIDLEWGLGAILGVGIAAGTALGSLAGWLISRKVFPRPAR